VPEVGAKAQYRNKVRIISDILSAIGAPNSGGANTASRLMRSCNVSYRSLDTLLRELVSAELVLHAQDRIRSGYFLTEKGLEYLKRYREFERFTETFGLQL
jgi:predicted transcriptional regulator